MSQPTETASSSSSANPNVIDVVTATFGPEVVERSERMLVLVDFWAPWCGPCRMLSPILEKLATELDGQFVLAKVNIDESPEVSAHFGVRSIPAVFAIKNGEVADAFMGVQPETTIRTWISRLLPTEAETLVRKARDLELESAAEAAANYTRALTLQPDLSQAEVGLARIALAEGRVDEATARILTLERRGYLEPEAEKLKAEITLQAQARETGGVEAARAALTASPDSLDLKFALAEALAAAGQYNDALALCLELVERDRKGVGERARQTMIAIFQLLPPGDDLTIEYQRQLSLVL